MADLNVAEWNPEQVSEWMRGLDDVFIPYVHFFLNNAIDGNHLLLLGPEDLPNLNVAKVGHQELILDAVEVLRHFHYNLNSENLQSLALTLSCKARSLFNDLKAKSKFDEEDGKRQRITTSVLSPVADMLVSVKNLISWLNRSPFSGQEQYTSIRNDLLHISIEVTTNASRDRFAEKPIDVIKECCLKLCRICDDIIQESKDPIILQPASLDVATIKKKADEELGIFIQSSCSGIHHIEHIVLQSPAHLCGRLEEGDEVVQVNYQTVIGWHIKKLLMILHESPTEVILTVKKRPHHSNVFGQALSQSLYFYHKKSAFLSRGLKRQDVSTFPESQPNFTITTEETTPKNTVEEDDEDDDSAFLPEDSETVSVTTGNHLFLPRSRAVVQRRATVTGASPNTTRPPVSIDQLWYQAKKEQVMRTVSHDPSKLLPEFHISDPIRKHKYSPLTKEDEDYAETSLKDIYHTSASISRPFTCIGADPITEAKIDDHCAHFIVGDRCHEIPIQLCCKEKEPSIKCSGVSCTTEFPSVPSEKEMFSHRKELTIDSATEDVQAKGAYKPLPSPKERRTVESKDTLDRNMSKKKKKDGSEKESSSVTSDVAKEPTNIDSPKTTQLHPSDSVTKNQTNGKMTPSSDSQSYQVLIAGGVPHITSGVSRELKKMSPKQSPVLRGKGKAWEFSNRRISCKDLGLGDCQGWLYKRKDQKGILAGSRWIKRWCILKNNNFYCFKDRDDTKAESLIYLPGFQVSPSPEIKSKKFAFKVYHSGTTFYFASDSQQDMSKWMNKMGLAAISYNAQGALTGPPSRTNDAQDACSEISDNKSIMQEGYYSETEDDGEENNIGNENPLESPNPCITPNQLSSSLSQMPSTPGTSESDVVSLVHSSSSGDLIPETSDPLQPEQTLNESLNSRNCNTLPKCSPIVSRKTSDVTTSDSIRKVNSCDYFVDKVDIYSVHSASFPCIKEKRNTSRESINLLQYEYGKYKMNAGKLNTFSGTPSSANISSISLHSVKCNSSPDSSMSSIALENQEQFRRRTRSYTSDRSFSVADQKKPFRGASLSDKLSKSSPDNAPLEKLLPKANLAPAFEMNLDHSPPGENVLISGDQHQSRRLSKPMLYLNKLSPRALKKLNSLSKSEKKRKYKRSTWFDQSDSEPSNVSSSDELLTHPKYISSSSQTDLQCLTHITSSCIIKARSQNRYTWQVKPNTQSHSMYKSATWDSRPRRSKSIWGGCQTETEVLKWSPPSETQYKTKLTIQICNVNDNAVEDEDALRTPLKPAMGISMIGKQRRSSTLSDKSEGKTAIIGSPISLSTTTQATQTDMDDELTQVIDLMSSAELTIDGTNVIVRHKKSYLTPSFDKQRTELMLLLKSLEHTLKDKENDLRAIECLLESSITSEVLLNWVKAYPHLCPYYELTSAGEMGNDSVV